MVVHNQYFQNLISAAARDIPMSEDMSDQYIALIDLTLNTGDFPSEIQETYRDPETNKMNDYFNGFGCISNSICDPPCDPNQHKNNLGFQFVREKNQWCACQPTLLATNQNFTQDMGRFLETGVFKSSNYVEIPVITSPYTKLSMPKREWGYLLQDLEDFPTLEEIVDFPFLIRKEMIHITPENYCYELEKLKSQTLNIPAEDLIDHFNDEFQDRPIACDHIVNQLIGRLKNAKKSYDTKSLKCKL